MKREESESLQKLSVFELNTKFRRESMQWWALGHKESEILKSISYFSYLSVDLLRDQVIDHV